LPDADFNRTLIIAMNTLLRFLLLAVACGGLTAGAAAPVPVAVSSVKIIFDTDIGNDCDDAMALAVIHALQNRAACELLAVTLTNPDPLAGRLVDAINTFYGRPDIPIGVNPASPLVTKESKYLKVAEAHPHDFDPARAPAAVALLRKTLAAANDGEIVIVQVGFFTNLAALLDSPGDEYSPLSGRELVKRKVRELSLMAGQFSPAGGSNYYSEFNVRYDVVSAVKVAAEWPTPAIWSGMEIGNAVLFPAYAVDRDFAYVASHPVQESYQLYRPTPHERPCFDLTSVVQAVWPERNYFELSQAGHVEVLPDGFTKFIAAKAKGARDRYLLVDRTQALRMRELLAALVTEAPALK
jgi:inosine-uridine nucleoside N-ribohydrolase